MFNHLPGIIQVLKKGLKRLKDLQLTIRVKKKKKKIFSDNILQAVH